MFQMQRRAGNGTGYGFSLFAPGLSSNDMGRADTGKRNRASDLDKGIWRDEDEEQGSEEEEGEDWEECGERGKAAQGWECRCKWVMPGEYASRG